MTNDQPIINRVAQSSLVTIDLEELYKRQSIQYIDLADFLLEGLVLVESRFRKNVSEIDPSYYNNSLVVLQCSTDAIIPHWAWVLMQLQVKNETNAVFHQDEAQVAIFNRIITDLVIDEYRDKPIIIKGCASIDVPVAAYMKLAEVLKPIAKSIMYGEACSAVPLFKKAK